MSLPENDDSSHEPAAPTAGNVPCSSVCRAGKIVASWTFQFIAPFLFPLSHGSTVSSRQAIANMAIQPPPAHMVGG